MEITATPASSLKVKTWSSFTINRAILAKDGTFKASQNFASIARTFEFVGDADEKPIKEVVTDIMAAEATSNPTVHIAADKIWAVMNSVPTPGMTVFDYLDQELEKLAKVALP